MYQYLNVLWKRFVRTQNILGIFERRGQEEVWHDDATEIHPGKNKTLRWTIQDGIHNP